MLICCNDVIVERFIVRSVFETICKKCSQVSFSWTSYVFNFKSRFLKNLARNCFYSDLQVLPPLHMKLVSFFHSTRKSTFIALLLLQKYESISSNNRKNALYEVNVTFKKITATVFIGKQKTDQNKTTLMRFFSQSARSLPSINSWDKLPISKKKKTGVSCGKSFVYKNLLSQIIKKTP